MSNAQSTSERIQEAEIRAKRLFFRSTALTCGVGNVMKTFIFLFITKRKHATVHGDEKEKSFIKTPTFEKRPFDDALAYFCFCFFSA